MIDFTVRIGVFAIVFAVLIAWQWYCPRAALVHWRQRWFHNLSLLVFGALSVRLVQPVLLSWVAWSNQGFGLFSWLEWPLWIVILMSILCLDCLIYWQHRLFHRLPILWRIHRVHHSDPELDVTSAVRFHPIEIILSLTIKALVVWLLGVPLVAVLFFDMLLNASAMFNHTNARLPTRLEAFMNTWLVTPDMHRIHHSRVNREANSNFGFFLSIWDTLFLSKTRESLQGDANLNIGLPDTVTYKPSSLKEVLMMPFILFKRRN